MKTTDDYTVALDPETEMHCTLRAYTNVANAEEIKRRLISGELRCCLVKLPLIVDPLQAVVAANRAAIAAKNGQLTTRSLYTEVLYGLSTSRNISRSLAEFGVGAGDRDVLAVMIHGPEEGPEISTSVEESIGGTRVPVSRLAEFTDFDLVRKMYRIEEDELRVSSYCDSVVSRISCKDFTALK